MEPMRCKSCGKELTDKTEIEYSEWLGEYFCNPDCAKNHYFDYMGSRPVDLSDKEFLRDEGIKIVKGRLYKVK